MKLTKGKKILLIVVLVIASLLIGNKVQGAAVDLKQFNDCYYESDGYVSEPHAWGCFPGDAQCSEPGAMMDDILGIGKANEGILYYNTSSDSDLKHFLGYAEHLGVGVEVMQHVVWASSIYYANGEHFNDVPGYIPSGSHNYSGNGGVIHAHKYAKAYYNLIVRGDIFKDYTIEDNIRIYVNQGNGKYIAGPYKFGLNYDDAAAIEAAQYLYQELLNAKNDSKAFAWPLEIQGINGTDAEYLDKDGNVIDFPDFVSQQEFYIRFTPDNDGAIKEVGKPLIRFGFYSGFYGNWTHWVDTGISFKARFCSTSPKRKKISDAYTETKKDEKTGEEKRIYHPAVYKTLGYYYYPPIGSNYYYFDIENLPNPDTWLSFGISAQNVINGISISTVLEGEMELEIKASGKITMELGGNVWLDGGEDKTGNYNGINGDEEDKRLGGIQVKLFELGGDLIATTTTDRNGQYRFYGTKNDQPIINPLKKYYVEFTYDGQHCQATYYQNSIEYRNRNLAPSMTLEQIRQTQGTSNAKDQNREDFNNRFATIYSENDNYNYNGWHKSFALKQKIKRDDGSFIAYNDGALTYEDVYDAFLELSTYEKELPEPSKSDYNTGWDREFSYEQVLNGTFSGWLSGMQVGADESEYIKQFIKDTFMTAGTYNSDGANQTYPVYNQFVPELFSVAPTYYELQGKTLTNRNDEREDDLDGTYTYLYQTVSDQARCVDFGICKRNPNDLAIQKDVLKATVIVNGKKQEYKYSKKDVDADGTWEVEVRAADALYNGQEIYERKIRKSEYLYDGSDSGTTDDKNLQVFVTYRIAVKNQGEMDTRLDEIVDYYDVDTYEFDGTLNGDTYTPKVYNYSPLEEKKVGQEGNTYVNSYVGTDKKGGKMQDIIVKTSGIPNGRAQETLTGANYNYSTLYLTGLKSVSGDDILERGEFAFAYVTFKVKNDISTDKIILDQDLHTGEVTVGKRNIVEINAYSTFYPDGATIPGNAGQDIPVGGKVSGIIDTDSNPGSLETVDLNDNGDIITSDNPVIDRQQDDTDKAPNIRIIINIDDDDTRRLKGYIFEDERTNSSNNAIIGDGVDNGETKIDGVTLQLVEIVQDVDENGIFTGNYIGEKVWASYSYNGIDSESLNNAQKDYSRYYSGQGTSKIIINGPEGTILHVDPDSLGQGEYTYKSLPAGNFYIRYIYGDTIQTVLTNDASNEVNQKIGQTGLNERSYNGQDYKSTIYQKDIDQDSDYNGIKGYTDYENQNYYFIDNLNVNETNDIVLNDPPVDKTKMYLYDIEKSSTQTGVSDGKDVYFYRERCNNWSKGPQENYEDKTIVNNRAETLASFEKLATAEDSDQIEMINQLIQNTFMVAQTGIVNTEIEYNRTDTDALDEDLKYTVDDIDLGLTERPKAQLRLTKQAQNVRIELANGQVLFDTGKSVNNLYFAEHRTHEVEYEYERKMREVILNKNNPNTSAELIQAYIDDELMVGATINVKYKLIVDNVGEVDYMDNQFYYTGETSDPSQANISKTNAVQVVDYVTNEMRFVESKQEEGSEWQVRTANELVESKVSGDVEKDYVNRKYKNELDTYNVLLAGRGLSEELVPNVDESGNSSKETTLILSTKLGGEAFEDNLIYNNLSEIIEISNEVGRRCAYSIVGNQEMADQSLGKNTAPEYLTRAERVVPNEIDADSAQRIVLMPPTGEEQNIMFITIGTLLFIGIAVCGVLIIKKLL